MAGELCQSQIEREHYFVKGRAITKGRIYLVGEESRRREPRRVDYLLRYRGEMIAVLEAMTWARTEIAISIGVRAPMSSPAGV